MCQHSLLPLSAERKNCTVFASRPPREAMGQLTSVREPWSYALDIPALESRSWSDMLHSSDIIALLLPFVRQFMVVNLFLYVIFIILISTTPANKAPTLQIKVLLPCTNSVCSVLTNVPVIAHHQSFISLLNIQVCTFLVTQFG